MGMPAGGGLGESEAGQHLVLDGLIDSGAAGGADEAGAGDAAVGIGPDADLEGEGGAAGAGVLTEGGGDGGLDLGGVVAPFGAAALAAATADAGAAGAA
jgi:hypothetical protein